MLTSKKFKKLTNRLKNILLVIMTFSSIYCAVHFSKECSFGIVRGLSFCLTVLIPSLFVFLVLASYISNSTVAFILAKPFSFITQKFFRLPGICAITLMLSLIGGYPVGAKSVYSLYKSGNISKTVAKKLSLIAISSGPGFVINYVGVGLFNNNKIAIILLASQVISFFIVALLVGNLINKENENHITSPQISSLKNGTSLVKAVEDGCKATVNMCAMVIAFSAIIAITDKVFFRYPILCDAITCVLEVTTACNRLSAKYPLYILSFCIGFSGICVHFQVFSALKEINTNKSLFFLFRIIQGIISGCTTYILLILFPVTQQVFSSVDHTSGKLSSPLWGCIALILTAVCFLNSISKVNLKRR